MKRGLGRGLDALLPGSEVALDDGPLRTVPLDRIAPNPAQPRRRFDESELDELARSIATLGILQPLLVRPHGSGYELVAGERRWRAAARAGLSEVPVLVVDTDERGALERALVENIHRTNLDPIEEAEAYLQLMEEAGLTQEALAQRLGRNRVSVSNGLRLLDLPDAIKKLLIERKLTAGHGKALLGLQDNPMQQRLAQRVAAEGLSVRETEDLVRRYQAMTGAVPRARGGAAPEASAAAAEAQRRLAHRLQTRVRVEMGKRKGKIVIDFVSLEELDRLLGEIAG